MGTAHAFDDGAMADGHLSGALPVTFKVPAPGPEPTPDTSANNLTFRTHAGGASQRIVVPPVQAPSAVLLPPPISPRPPPPPPRPPPPLFKAQAKVWKRPANQSKGNTKQNPICRRCGHQKSGNIGGVEARHFHKHGRRWCSTTDADFCIVHESLRLPGYPMLGYAPSRSNHSLIMPWQIASGLPAMGPWALSAAARMAVSPPSAATPSVQQG
jgi:hypothetical protein